MGKLDQQIANIKTSILSYGRYTLPSVTLDSLNLTARQLLDLAEQKVGFLLDYTQTSYGIVVIERSRVSAMAERIHHDTTPGTGLNRFVKTHLGLLMTTFRTITDASLKEMADALAVTPSLLSDWEFGRGSNLECRLPDIDAFYASKGLYNTLTLLQFAYKRDSNADN